MWLPQRTIGWAMANNGIARSLTLQVCTIILPRFLFTERTIKWSISYILLYLDSGISNDIEDIPTYQDSPLLGENRYSSNTTSPYKSPKLDDDNKNTDDSDSLERKKPPKSERKSLIGSPGKSKKEKEEEKQSLLIVEEVYYYIISKWNIRLGRSSSFMEWIFWYRMWVKMKARRRIYREGRYYYSLSLGIVIVILILIIMFLFASQRTRRKGKERSRGREREDAGGGTETPFGTTKVPSTNSLQNNKISYDEFIRY